MFLVIIIIKITTYLNKHLQTINIYHHISNNYDTSGFYNRTENYILHPEYWYSKIRPYLCLFSKKLVSFYLHDVINYHIIQIVLKLLKIFNKNQFLTLYYIIYTEKLLSKEFRF